MESERGEFRAIHVALIDDAGFLDLSPDARHCFYPAKLILGLYGIRVVRSMPAELSHATGLGWPAITQALAELADKRWLLAERHVWWLRNGLRFEPSISLKNKLHRVGAVAFLKTLPHLSIVREFAAYYGLDFPGQDSTPPPSDSELSTNEAHGQSHGQSHGGEQKQKQKQKQITERASFGRTDGDVSTSKSTEKAEPENPPLDDALTELRTIFPKRAGRDPRIEARRNLETLFAAGESFAAIRKGVLRYASHCQARGITGTQYVMRLCSFLDPGEMEFKKPWDPPARVTAGEAAFSERPQDPGPRIGSMESLGDGVAHESRVKVGAWIVENPEAWRKAKAEAEAEVRATPAFAGMGDLLVSRIAEARARNVVFQGLHDGKGVSL